MSVGVIATHISGYADAKMCIRDRVLDFAGKTYTLGALVQSNFGRMEDLMICGQPVGNRIAQELHPKNSKDEGSIMIIIGTDIPLSARQLKRVLKRAAVGLVRTGSYMGHGSGDAVSYPHLDVYKRQV